MKKMPLEDVEKCRKYTEVFHEILEDEDDIMISAYLEGYMWILCGEVRIDEPEFVQCFFDAGTFLKDVKNRWIFHKVMHLYDTRAVKPGLADNLPVEEWLEHLPEPYKTELKEKLDALLKECE